MGKIKGIPLPPLFGEAKVFQKFYFTVTVTFEVIAGL